MLDAGGLDDADMLRIAGEVGYAETAFVTGETAGARDIRYFSPVAEVPFCGHATVATAIAVAEREGPGRVRFATPVGEVGIETAEVDGALRAAFTSVEPAVEPMPEPVLDALLDLTGLPAAAFDERHPPHIAFAGNRHPVLVVADAAAFDGFGSTRPRRVRSWTSTAGPRRSPCCAASTMRRTAACASRPATSSRSARSPRIRRQAPRPPRSAGTSAASDTCRRRRVLIAQGRHVGRPSELVVDIPERGGIVVSGTAVAIG